MEFSNSKNNLIISAAVVLAVIVLGLFIFVNNKKPDISSWLTFTDPESGVTFRYPENLGTTYISTTDWPPRAGVIAGPVECVEAGEETARAGETKEHTIGGKTYCVTKVSEGAAGSTYTMYAYGKEIENDQMLFLTFSLRFPQCGNYEDPQKSACEKEQSGFDIDSLMGQIFNTVKLPKEAGQAVITIKDVEIQEDNFTGSMPVISGRGEMVDAAKSFVEDLVYGFKIQANKDVPELRSQFGADTPTLNYSLEVKGDQVASDITNSIVISVYAYTGGANGNSYYKVFTSSKKTGKILSLSDVIKDGKEAAFTDLVKKKLLAWRPQGSTGSVVFPDEVQALTFSNLSNFSLDSNNLNIYFAKYDVGPGALGAVVLPVPRAEIKDMLDPAI